MSVFARFSVAIVLAASLTPVSGADSAPPDRPALKARPFDLGRVRLLDGPFEQAMQRTRRYLLSLDLDRQVHMFRLTAGLPSSAKPLGGWEAPEDQARGEFFGHSLSARAMMYAMTGDARLLVAVNRLVAELAQCQAALGQCGYLGAVPESTFDRIEKGELVWGGYYTVHKIMAGLLDAHAYCGNQQALVVARKLADWVELRTRGQSADFIRRVWHPTLHVEWGGLNESLLNVYAITGDPRHLVAARRFDDDALYSPLAAGHDELTGLHVNTAIPKIIGAARAYELTGDSRFRRIAEFFWRQVTAVRSYATGGTSNNELWSGEPGRLAGQLSARTQECCTTYNMLKLTRHIFTWTADPRAADYYERALWNGILGTQREDGMMMYYVPLASGYWKTFCSPLDSFWCCTGTGVESFSKLGESIYYQDDDGLLVNLFLASELDWAEKGLRIRQETRFPEQEGTSLLVLARKPVTMALRIRVPYWATGGVTLRLNGAGRQVQAAPASYAVIRRTWHDGDRLEVAMPMSLHPHAMPDNKSLVPIMYGPLVLAGRLGKAGLTPKQLSAPTMAPEGAPVAAPSLVVDGDELSSWIRPTGRPLEFHTLGQAAEVTLVPFYQLFDERYAVYWNVYRKGSPEQREELAREACRRAFRSRTIDAVETGDPESEAAHALAGEKTADSGGPYPRWRDATSGGWFSYRMKVVGDEPMTLRCTYWGGDVPPRRFQILVGDREIAVENLDRKKPGEYVDTEYPIPPELTKAKESVTVRFQAFPDNIAGGLFGLKMLK